MTAVCQISALDIYVLVVCSTLCVAATQLLRGLWWISRYPEEPKERYEPILRLMGGGIAGRSMLIGLCVLVLAKENPMPLGQYFLLLAPVCLLLHLSKILMPLPELSCGDCTKKEVPS